MKKLILALIIVFIVLSIAGCRPSAGNDSKETPKPVATELMKPTATILSTPTAHPDLLVMPSDLASEQITFWHPFTGEVRTVIQSLVNEFNQSNQWGVFVEIHDFSSFDLIRDEILNVKDKSELPDVITAPPEFLVGQRDSSAPIIALDPYVDSILYGIKDEEDYFNAVWNGDVDGGVRYGIPAYRSAQVMFYNQTWAQELGFDTFPMNLEEWKNQACTAALFNNSDSSRNNDGTGGWIVDLFPETWFSWSEAFQDGVVNKDIQFLFSTPENESAFQFIRTASDDGCTWFAREQKPQDYLRDGLALFYTAPLEYVLIQEYSITKTSSLTQWEVIPFPGMARNSDLIVSGYSYGIYKSTPVRQMAGWIFIRWLQEPERLARIVKASASIPFTKTELELLANYGAQHPQWLSAIGYLDNAQMTPPDGDWEIARLVLQDVAWQTLQANVTSAEIPELLRQADDAVADIKAQLNNP